MNKRSSRSGMSQPTASPVPFPFSLPPHMHNITVNEIPSVTQFDLDTFHAQHFTTQAAAPDDNYDVHPDGEHEYEDEEEEDGLGYYPDGVKRTLTDEQIAIFRHSEIQELRRLREQQREAEELAAAIAEEDSLAQEGLNRDEQAESGLLPEIDDDEGLVDEETTSHAGQRQTQRAGRLAVPARGKSPVRASERKRQKLLKKSYRTRDEHIDRHDEHGHTHRRHARDADEVKNESVVLDY